MNKGFTSNSNNPIQESLKLLNQCPLCKGDYKTDESNILEKNDSAHLVHITCPHCNNAVVILVTISQVGMSSVGMVTDLTAGDVVRLRQESSVSGDEVLGFYQLLKLRNKEFLNQLIIK